MPFKGLLTYRTIQFSKSSGLSPENFPHQGDKKPQCRFFLHLGI